MHKWYRNAGKTLADRLREQSVEDGDCRVWTGTKDSDGYGVLTFQTRNWRAHRAAWAVAFGEVPDGLMVLHACDNPSCVNSDHLMLGSGKANVIDRDRKGRTATGDRNGARIHREKIGPAVRAAIAARPEIIRRGEDAGAARLTADTVREIRKLYAEGARQVDLAARFGITQTHVSWLVRRKSWAHV